MIKFLGTISSWLNRILAGIAAVVLGSMVVLTCANITLRRLGSPISGTFELMGLGGAVVAAFGLGVTQHRKENISVDILVNSFGPLVREILNSVNYTLCMLFFLLAGWQLAARGWRIAQSAEVTETLRIVYYPFVFAVSLGAFALALTFGADLLMSLCQIFRRSE